MQKHTKTYFSYFGIESYVDGSHDYIECSIPECGKESNDLHHIEARGMGGSKYRDVIENLIPLCREHHEEYGDVPKHKEWLKQLALEKLLSLRC